MLKNQTVYKKAWVQAGPHTKHVYASLFDDGSHRNILTESPYGIDINNFPQSQYATYNCNHQAAISDICIADTDAEC